ncbi:MAG TPA: hypothetical protein DCG57_08340 [Candidatus Riflebacteria bacterium]|jgi:hypothetical protein|nr:hypothetical protein [Candidatus Riflebacteria bacterium]
MTKAVDNRSENSGAIGLTVVVLVLGFMMSISTTYVMMVHTEFQIGDAIDSNARAKDAALAGVHFAIARLQATSTTYLVQDTNTSLSNRLYFARSALVTDKNLRFSGLTPSNFTNVASSQWLFPIESTTSLGTGEEPDASMFKVTTYPATKTASIIDHSKYYVKSQGMYRIIDPATFEVTATFSAQILARLSIATPTRSVRIDVYQFMEIEPSTNSADSFFSARQILP